MFGDLSVDVAIVGEGLTGLWTAYYLAKADPSLKIAVLEKEIAGFGASGRNGGWCSALFPASTAALAGRHGIDAALALRQAMVDTVSEVGRATEAEGIDCDYVRGGTVSFAHGPAQLRSALAEVAEAARYGVDRMEFWDSARTPQGASGGIRVHQGQCHPPSIRPAPDCIRQSWCADSPGLSSGSVS